MANALDEYIAPIEAIREYSSFWIKGRGTHEAGVYLLLQDDEVVYAGQASSICWRLMAHSRSDKVWNKYYDIEVPDAKMRNDVEDYYIRFFNPKLNRKDGRGSSDVDDALCGRQAPEVVEIIQANTLPETRKSGRKPPRKPHV